MNKFKNLLFILILLPFAAGCETDTEVSNTGLAAKIYYTPACATINGYLTLDSNVKTYVFQHEIDEKFQESGLEVFVDFQLEEQRPLTAECTQAEIIKITSIRER
ncbi:hypothetical protein FHG64_03525 [Antarcticibacterium flavum]|uniref:DUF4377 domain-containing protein n=1 Tax=Antarcticibacterium flavum TaxID=2058175 RepID=A0A5B7WZ87_9FLAO|nr:MULTISPECIES: hypothetical protein [Antarcticibacterium]MCM4158681.1 hypothetical protein [Antarcticibacterium sp. W02-3]QCY68534.1 hypothetical protein FHG64_03525 [Antarcticibacterium flavum]